MDRRRGIISAQGEAPAPTPSNGLEIGSSTTMNAGTITAITRNRIEVTGLTRGASALVSLQNPVSLTAGDVVTLNFKYVEGSNISGRFNSKIATSDKTVITTIVSGKTTTNINDLSGTVTISTDAIMQKLGITKENTGSLSYSPSIIAEVELFVNGVQVV